MAKQKPADDQPAPKAAENISSLELKLDDPPPPVEATEPAATTTTEAEPTTPDTPQVGADEPSLLPSAVSLARQRGYEVSDDATDEDFWSHLETVEQQAAKATEHERELETLRQQLAERQQQAQVDPAPKPAAGQATEPAAVDTGIPDRPAIDKFTMQVLRFAQANGKLSEVGGYVTTDDQTIKPQVDAYNKHLDDVRDYDAEWTPRKIAEHILDQRLAKEREELRKQVTEEVRGTLTQRDTQSFIDSFNAKHADVLASEVGKQFSAKANSFLERGFDPEEAIELATAFVQRQTGRDPFAPAQAPAALPTPAKKNISFINRVKNNGVDLIPTTPVSRPAAAAATRSTNGLTLDQKLSAKFSHLMSEKVADRM